LNSSIKVRQSADSSTTQIVQVIEPKQQTALFWTDSKADKNLSFLISTPSTTGHYSWSASFNPKQVGNYGLTVHHSTVEEKVKFIRVQNAEDDSMHFIKITEFQPIGRQISDEGEKQKKLQIMMAKVKLI